MPPRKRKATTVQTQKTNTKKPKEEPSSSPTPSEKEIIATTLPKPPAFLHKPVKAASSLVPAYLIYTLLYTEPSQPPSLVIRRVYESRSEALEAFHREYTTWKTEGIYAARHTAEQFKPSYLANIMDMNKERSTTVVGEREVVGIGRVKYDLVHKEDLGLKDVDPQKRRCSVICEETVFEKNQ